MLTAGDIVCFRSMAVVFGFQGHSQFAFHYNYSRVCLVARRFYGKHCVSRHNMLRLGEGASFAVLDPGLIRVCGFFVVGWSGVELQNTNYPTASRIRLTNTREEINNDV